MRKRVTYGLTLYLQFVFFSEKKLTKYFPESYSADDMEQVIESLLEKWSQEQND